MDQLLFPLLEVTHNHTAQGNGVPQLGVTSGGPNHPGFLGSDNSQNTPRVGLCEQDSVRRLFSCIPSFPLSMMLMKVAQLCPTLCDPMDCILPGSSVHGISQARMLEWVAIPFSREFSWPRGGTWYLALQVDSLPSEPPRKPNKNMLNN